MLTLWKGYMEKVVRNRGGHAEATEIMKEKLILIDLEKEGQRKEGESFE